MNKPWGRMSDLRTTNWLLLGILMALLVHLGREVLDAAVVFADADGGPYHALSLTEWCVTKKANDKPKMYLHVVTHNYAGE